MPDGLVVMAAQATGISRRRRDPWFEPCRPAARFAVRSSGIGEDGEGGSFAGIHETVLDVPRSALRPRPRHCLASSRFAAGARVSPAKGLSTDTIEMALLVQRMVHPVAAGVAFTVNPVSGAEHEMVINSSWGLGEALVSGRIDPDEFVVNKRDGTLKWSRLGQKGDETSEPIASLSGGTAPRTFGDADEDRTALRRATGRGVVPDDDGLWIVQSRPVTTDGSAPRRKPNGRARTSRRCCPT